MARGLFITGFTISEVLAIQQRAKDLVLEGKTIMNWNDAETSVSKQFTMPVDQVLEECGHCLDGREKMRARGEGHSLGASYQCAMLVQKFGSVGKILSG